MGTRIEAVSTAWERTWPLGRGARYLAAEAARQCLARAGKVSTDVDLLINVGIYREDALAEPALAAMIQEDIGANPGHPPREHCHGTFSFDVANGGCGVLDGLAILDGFLKSRTIRTGLLVASDSHAHGQDHFPFSPAGGAILVGPSDEPEGFTAFAFESFSVESSADLESTLDWRSKERRLPFSPRGRHTLAVTQGEDYARRAVECAASTARRFLAQHGMTPSDVDLLVPSQTPVPMISELAARLELDATRVARAGSGTENVHTAGPIAALDAAADRFAQADTVLFVTVGAGIEVGVALYRHQRSSRM